MADHLLHRDFRATRWAMTLHGDGPRGDGGTVHAARPKA